MTLSDQDITQHEFNKIFSTLVLNWSQNLIYCLSVTQHGKVKHGTLIHLRASKWLII